MMCDKRALVHSTFAAVLAILAGCASEEAGSSPMPDKAPDRWCDLLPRPANLALERVEVQTEWFHVYRVEDGIFALIEPKQFQETISYLIIGTERALMFDTGLGMAPIREVVEQLTDLPIDVLNSHTHFDHVGGNAEFESILAFDSAYTRANQQGHPPPELAGEVASESFCDGPPKGLETASFHSRPWPASDAVADEDTFDLGGRVLEVLHVPGHTPDALALLDRERGLLWTGDSYYEGTIWLFVPETDLDAYQSSIDRMAALAPSLKRVLPAHNTASSDPTNLIEVSRAIRQVRSGSLTGVEETGGRVVFRFEDFNILTSKQLLAGEKGSQTEGGSGLTTWR